MNLLKQSRINPRQSAYAELFGQYNVNALPLVPIGTGAIIFQTRTNQTTSYSNHGKNGLYIWSCLDKFQNYKVYVTAIKGTQEINRVNFFPTKRRLPNTDSIDCLSVALEDFKYEYTPSSTNHPFVKSKHGTNLNKVIKRMKELF